MKKFKSGKVGHLAVFAIAAALVATSTGAATAAPDADEQVQNFIQRVAPNQEPVLQEPLLTE